MGEETIAHFWIEATPESEEMVEKLDVATAACLAVHEWTIMQMRKKWLAKKEMQASLLSQAMTDHIGQLGLLGAVQRYSLVHAMNRAVARFHQELVIDGWAERKAEVVFPDPSPPNEYVELAIESRSVWKKYVYQHGQVSTTYGYFYLEGEWPQTLANQARLHGVTLEMLPYLWYSIIVKREEGGPWLARFTVHNPASKVGKKSIKRKKERDKWQ